MIGHRDTSKSRITRRRIPLSNGICSKLLVVNVDLQIRNAQSGAIQPVLNPLVRLAADVGSIIRLAEEADLIDHRAFGEALGTLEHTVLDALDRTDIRTDPLQHRKDVLTQRVVGQGDIDIDQMGQPADLGDIAVRDRQDRAIVEELDLGRANGEVDHDAVPAVIFDRVADLEEPIGLDHQTGEDILQRVFDRESDNRRHDAESHHDGGNIDAADLQDPQQRDRDQGDLGDAIDRGERIQPADVPQLRDLLAILAIDDPERDKDQDRDGHDQRTAHQRLRIDPFKRRLQ